MNVTKLTTLMMILLSCCIVDLQAMSLVPVALPDAPSSLCKAARAGNIVKLQALIAAGADVNSKNEHGWIPLIPISFQ
jgi:hypothetical protein